MDRVQIITSNAVAADWADINPVLFKGEIGLELDTKRLKIGDGFRRWVDLPYAKASATDYKSGNGVLVNGVEITADLQYEVIH